VALKNILDNGKSYAAASFEALRKTYGDSGLIDELANSNNILAIEYIKSLKKIKSSIIPVAIKRVCNDYAGTCMTGEISSATAIRETIISSGIETVKQSISNASETIINNEFSIGRGPVSMKSFEDILLWSIRSKTSSEIAMINDFDVFRSMNNPGYIKVLDFNERGKEILARIKKNSNIPVITKTSKLRDIDNYAVKRLVEINQKASDLYVLGYQNKSYKFGGQEFTTNNIDYKK